MMWMNIILGIAVFICLLIEAVKDIRTRTIDSRILIFSSAPLTVLRVFLVGDSFVTAAKDVAAGAIIGIIFIVISIASRESVGFGDALVISWLGVVLGGIAAVAVLGICMIFNFVIAIFLFFKRKRKLRIPMVPFMLGGYIVYLAGLIIQPL